MHIGLLRRCIGAARREGNGHFVPGLFRRLLDRGASAQNNQIGERNLLASGLGAVEFLLDFFKGLEHGLQSWVTVVVLPLFALANAGLVLKDLNLYDAITNPITLGVALGLAVGKPVGILIFTYLVSKIARTSLPPGVKWSHIAGAGILGGIGFTMSIFISGLSFSSNELNEFAKLGIILGSLFSGILGLLALSFGNAKQTTQP